MPSTSQSEPEVANSEARAGYAGAENASLVHARPHDAPSLKHWLLGILSILFVPLMLLGMLEAGLHAFNVGFPTELMQPCSTRGQAANCYNLFFVAPFFPPGMIKTPQVYAIPAAKPQDTFRIFVLGESAAMGDPDPAYGFSRYLEVMLRRRFPDRNFEVVNTGSVAINSHVLLRIAKGLADQKPDAFIIYSGNNEVVGPYGPGTVLTSSAMALPVIRSSIFFHSTRIGQLLTKLGTPKRDWAGMEMFLDKQVPASSPLMRTTYQNFERNLLDTITVAQSTGATVIVSTVATDLKDCAPFASLHKEGLSQDALRSWERLVQQGSASEDAKSYVEALQEYRAADRIDDQYAELEFRIARCLWMLSDFAGAREHFGRARDLDTLRFRADSTINEINRKAAALTGARLVDAESLLASESPNGVLGSEMVYEHVHLTPDGNYRLARAMFQTIAKGIAAANGQNGDAVEPISQSEAEQLLAFTEHDRTRIAREMWQRLQKPPFMNQLNHADQVLRMAIRASSPDENPAQTAEEYEWALRQNPEDRVLHYNFGLFLFDYNRNAAGQQLRESRPWDGFPVFAPDGTLL